ncbi:MAG TPA: hypothetical protein VGV09_19440 [Steroidobacteraceae bacterium]|nr:hypothetical protein [Steroidobacteraceae bacterium]
MELYGNLFESMLAWCAHSWLRRGPVYTLSMLALGLGVCLNVLSVIDLLWSIGILANPYHAQGESQPHHYVWALLCLAFLFNTFLARRKFSADRRVRSPAATASSTSAATYVLCSTALFLITLYWARP